MDNLKIVIDTNVILSGLKSKNGFSYKLLKLIPEKKITLNVSVPLILEYESILKSKKDQLKFNNEDINNFIDYLCKVANHIKIYYLWRPILKDPNDDHVLELAVASNSNFIITHNLKDFKESIQFGIESITPKNLLFKLGEI